MDTASTEIEGDRDHDSPSEIGPAEANRRFYATHAAIYDETEFCAEDEAPSEQLRERLNRALALVGDRPRILDAGGGTGMVSLMLHEMGHDTVLIDASPEMVARWERKARERGIEPSSELADLERFFDNDVRSWHLIVFSSVLHHLVDPGSMIASAGRRLLPGGAILTIFDPLAVDRTGTFLRRLDYACWIAIHSPATLARAIGRRVRELLNRPSAAGEPNFGELAERHAMTGLDDSQIIERARVGGLRVADHERISDARYRWIAALSRAAGQRTHFSLVLVRPVDREDVTASQAR